MSYRKSVSKVSKIVNMDHNINENFKIYESHRRKAYIYAACILNKTKSYFFELTYFHTSGRGHIIYLFSHKLKANVKVPLRISKSIFDYFNTTFLKSKINWKYSLSNTVFKLLVKCMAFIHLSKDLSMLIRNKVLLV